MEIKEREYSLADGFAWIVFVEGGVEYTLQACLIELKKCEDEKIRYKMVQNKENLYKKAINKNDDGMDWGLSGEANEPAFTKFGVDYCMKLFKKEMRVEGIRFE